MATDIDCIAFINEIVRFLESLRDAQLPTKIENEREQFLIRARNTLSATSPNSPGHYLYMNAGKAFLLAEKDTEEYVNADEQQPRVPYDKSRSSQGTRNPESTLSISSPIIDENDMKDANDLMPILLNFTAGQAKGYSLKTGRLWQKKKGILFFGQDQYPQCWVALLRTHLLLYGGRNCTKPFLVLALQGYIARANQNIRWRSSAGFELFKKGSPTYQFVGKTQKDMEQWVTKICQLMHSENDTKLPTIFEPTQRIVEVLSWSDLSDGSDDCEPIESHAPNRERSSTLHYEKENALECKKSKQKKTNSNRDTTSPLLPIRKPVPPLPCIPDDNFKTDGNMEDHNDDDNVYQSIADYRSIRESQMEEEVISNLQTKTTPNKSFPGTIINKREVSRKEENEIEDKGMNSIQIPYTYDDPGLLKMNRNIQLQVVDKTDYDDLPSPKPISQPHPIHHDEIIYYEIINRKEQVTERLDPSKLETFDLKQKPMEHKSVGRDSQHKNTVNQNKPLPNTEKSSPEKRHWNPFNAGRKVESIEQEENAYDDISNFTRKLGMMGPPKEKQKQNSPKPSYNSNTFKQLENTINQNNTLPNTEKSSPEKRSWNRSSAERKVELAEDQPKQEVYDDIVVINGKVCMERLDEDEKYDDISIVTKKASMMRLSKGKLHDEIPVVNEKKHMMGLDKEEYKQSSPKPSCNSNTSNHLENTINKNNPLPNSGKSSPEKRSWNLFSAIKRAKLAEDPQEQKLKDGISIINEKECIMDIGEGEIYDDILIVIKKASMMGLPREKLHDDIADKEEQTQISPTPSSNNNASKQQEPKLNYGIVIVKEKECTMGLDKEEVYDDISIVTEKAGTMGLPKEKLHDDIAVVNKKKHMVGLDKEVQKQSSPKPSSNTNTSKVENIVNKNKPLPNIEKSSLEKRSWNLFNVGRRIKLAEDPQEQKLKDGISIINEKECMMGLDEEEIYDDISMVIKKASMMGLPKEEQTQSSPKPSSDRNASKQLENTINKNNPVPNTEKSNPEKRSWNRFSAERKVKLVEDRQEPKLNDGIGIINEKECTMGLDKEEVYDDISIVTENAGTMGLPKGDLYDDIAVVNKNKHMVGLDKEVQKQSSTKPSSNTNTSKFGNTVNKNNPLFNIEKLNPEKRPWNRSCAEKKVLLGEVRNPHTQERSSNDPEEYDDCSARKHRFQSFKDKLESSFSKGVSKPSPTPHTSNKVM